MTNGFNNLITYDKSLEVNKLKLKVNDIWAINSILGHIDRHILQLLVNVSYNSIYQRWCQNNE